MRCNSINPDFQQVCNNIEFERYCQFCEGTSGLSREKEEAYLIQLGVKNGLDIKTSGSPKLPSVWQQAKNLGKAALKHAANLFQICPDEVIEMRKGICGSCDKLNPERRCSECGCYVDVKAKWASEECPLKKWVAIANDQSSESEKSGGCGCGK